jgi:hypothetical protein
MLTVLISHLFYDSIMKSILKKIATITFLLTIAHKVFAPTSEALVIVSSSPVEPFRNLIHAIGMVETQFDTLAYNPIEEAVGYFQIRPIRLLDYNIRTGSKYSSHDLFDYGTSEKIFLFYASGIGPYDFERIARTWNGSGKNTGLYWNQVKRYL